MLDFPSDWNDLLIPKSNFYLSAAASALVVAAFSDSYVDFNKDSVKSFAPSVASL